ncbi:DUF3703 domain-containing protein [uncultured Piscinibacter sp.]|uniref:DUF3703 domain-containing protein n=1 Tax=uncultured Piscinibacter sp. TaxID=1131835 RepID=UPI00261176FB|nr:DUF3703 domain-containing protein [uncultured Piscinibacter sp.]MCK6422474.1 DUF3703 domain-containing protein [Aquabacterium sp.]
MTTTTGSRRIEAFEAAMAEAARHRSAGDAKSAFAALERAHVLGQLDFVPHLRVHWQMLRAGWAAGDRREVAGQLMRIALVPVGHLVGRLPVGNTGGSNVSAFKPMAIPPDLERLIEDRDR